MTVVVFGVDALDPELDAPERQPNLTLAEYSSIETIQSVAGEPSTHELWPTIITGLPPTEHGLELDDGVAWQNPLLRAGSSAANHLLPDTVQTRIGAWLLNNTEEDAFRVPATYYEEQNLPTVLDGEDRLAIGIPNYVVDPDTEDREHQLRTQMGALFERDPEAVGGHVSADPEAFYEQCLEMAMIRTARLRRGVRGRRYELVFGYTSGLDLVGHVSPETPERQQRAYDEFDDFVGELRADLDEGDELLLVSDHGLQDGLHTDEAMIASTTPELPAAVDSVLDVRGAIEDLLRAGTHDPESGRDSRGVDSEAVQKQLEDLGYM